MTGELEILSISGNVNAAPGETVNLTIMVFNNHATERIFAIVKGTTGSTVLESSSNWVEENAQRVFGLSFLMPEQPVEIDVSVHQWDFDASEWVSIPDDTQTVIVTPSASTITILLPVIMLVMVMMMLSPMMRSIPELLGNSEGKSKERLERVPSDN